jgi:hypothetical protein
MADRRMISVKIAGSAKFIKLPLSTQALYFHLVINADDDGIVEAFNVMRIIGASEGDFQLLIDKEYIVLLNEDFVTYIPHWLEHNLMRDDRKVNSIYQSLLLEKVKDVKVMIPRPRKDRKQKFLQVGTSQGRPMDVLGTDMGQQKLGKDNLSKDNESKDNVKEDKNTKKNFRGFDNVFLTDDEYEEIEFSYGGVATYHIIKKLSNWKLAQNKTTHSDYGAIESWVVKAVKEEKGQLFVYPSQDQRLERAERKKMEKEKCLSSQ